MQRSFDEALAEWRARGGRHPYQERHVSTSAERHAEVAAAAELLAGQHPEIIALAGRAGAIPVLSWTTPAGELALYEPSRGTAVGLTQRAPRAVAMQIFGHEPGAQP